MEEKTKFRIIGDIHGLVTRYATNRMPYAGDKGLVRTYASIVADTEQSIQLGDMGWREDMTYVKHFVDPKRHRLLGGNHDDYDNLLPHHLGDFGVYAPAGIPIDFFYIRGEYSIDKNNRSHYGPDKTWWQQEEMSYARMQECLSLYEQIKPDVVLSHGAPSVLFNRGLLTNDRKLEPSNTAKFLDYIFKAHAPSRWYFGHHHHDYRLELNGTKFECINELCWVEVDENGNFGEQQ